MLINQEEINAIKDHGDLMTKNPANYKLDIMSKC